MEYLKMKQVKINVMKQSGNSLFAFSDEIVSPKKATNKQKILGSGELSSLTELHNEMFNAAKQAFKGEDIEFIVNDNKYGAINANDDELVMSKAFPESEIEKLSNVNTVNFKIMKNPLGMYRLKREDEANLYSLEDEKYLRDTNGFSDFKTKEEMLDVLSYYYKNDEKQNTYTTQQKDKTKVLVEGELFDEFQNRQSLNKQMPNIKNKHSVDRKSSLRM